jgi:cytochrome c553
VRPGIQGLIRRPCLLSAVLGGLLAAPAGAQTTDADVGRSKAQACVVCHGMLGISSAPDAPHLAGQPALYTAAQLRAYRSGTRRHEVMAVMAKALTDEDIAQLAAWYASVRIEATAPR